MNMATSGKGKNIALWVLRVVLGLAFLGAGGAKLAGAPPMVAIFSKIGWGQGLRILTGALEVVGALGLFVPKFTTYAASLLALVMLGAIGFHLTTLGGNPAPPIVLLVLSGLTLWLSRPTAAGVK